MTGEGSGIHLSTEKGNSTEYVELVVYLLELTPGMLLYDIMRNIIKLVFLILFLFSGQFLLIPLSE